MVSPCSSLVKEKQKKFSFLECGTIPQLIQQLAPSYWFASSITDAQGAKY